MRSILGPLLGLAYLLLADIAQAAKLIAVLPLDVSNAKGKLDKEAQASFEEMLRDVATNTLAPLGWTVLTHETTIQVLRDNGVMPEECGNQSCHLEMAREIKAERFLSGSVQLVEGIFTASVRLVDTSNGRILASERVEGKTVTALRKEFEVKAETFLIRGGMLDQGRTDSRAPSAPAVESTGPQVKKGTVTEALSSLMVTAKPKELVRLELIDPKGRTVVSAAPYKNERAEPGRWKISAKASGYEEEAQDVIVPADDVMVVKFELNALGGLSVVGEPSGAAVEVTGPGEFRDYGGLPWEATGLKHGVYEVRVTRNGYIESKEWVTVMSGQTSTLKVMLRKVKEPESVAAETPNRMGKAALEVVCEKPSRVYVDGERLGISTKRRPLQIETSPGPHRVYCEEEGGAMTRKDVTLRDSESKTVQIR